MVNTSLKTDISKLTKWLIVSAAMGVSISYGDFYLFHFVLLISLTTWLYNLKEKNFIVSLRPFIGFHGQTLIGVFVWYLLSLFWSPNFLLEANPN